MRRAGFGDEGVVLGVGDGGEVGPVGRLRAGYERYRHARDVEVEGGEEDVPRPRLEGDRAELCLVDTLQLHVDTELLPCAIASSIDSAEFSIDET